MLILALLFGYGKCLELPFEYFRIPSGFTVRVFRFSENLENIKSLPNIEEFQKSQVRCWKLRSKFFFVLILYKNITYFWFLFDQKLPFPTEITKKIHFGEFISIDPNCIFWKYWYFFAKNAKKFSSKNGNQKCDVYFLTNFWFFCWLKISIFRRKLSKLRFHFWRIYFNWPKLQFRKIFLFYQKILFHVNFLKIIFFGRRTTLCPVNRPNNEIITTPPPEFGQKYAIEIWIKNFDPEREICFDSILEIKNHGGNFASLLWGICTKGIKNKKFISCGDSIQYKQKVYINSSRMQIWMRTVVDHGNFVKPFMCQIRKYRRRIILVFVKKYLKIYFFAIHENKISVKKHSNLFPKFDTLLYEIYFI